MSRVYYYWKSLIECEYVITQLRLETFDWVKPTELTEHEKTWSLADAGEWEPISVTPLILQTFKGCINEGTIFQFYSAYGPLNFQQRKTNRFSYQEFYEFRVNLLSSKKKQSDRIKLISGSDGMHFQSWPYALEDYIACLYWNEVIEQQQLAHDKEYAEIGEFNVCLAPNCHQIISKPGQLYCNNRCTQAHKNHKNRYAKEHYGYDTWKQAKDAGVIKDIDINSVNRKLKPNISADDFELIKD